MTQQREQVLVKRINRHLRDQGLMLRKTRGLRMQLDYGEYYVHNFERNLIDSHHVDPEALAREMELLRT